MSQQHSRLASQINQPLLVRLHRALTRLASPLTVMNTGAHPDDEQNGMLAMLRMERGMRVVVACSTRGEGGQNALGPERRGALGLLRSAEMEQSMRAIDADIHWLGHGPDDPVHDFGFSKDGDDSLNRWGEERLLERLVRAYRTERPDIVIPTFLDVPGQHGHHRAMTRAAETAIGLAADPAAFSDHAAAGLTPWRVKKFYLPAWSGGGGTYDDEVPPPEATMTLQATAPDPATGVPYDRIGQWSRASHASQGMGFWQTDPVCDWPLHLLDGPRGTVSEVDIAEDLSEDWSALADWPGLLAVIAAELRQVEAMIHQAIAAFPDMAAVTEALLPSAVALARMNGTLPDDFAAAHGHRLVRLARNIDRVLIIAAGFEPVVWSDPPVIAPGGSAVLRVQCAQSLPETTEVVLHCGAGLAAGGESVEGLARCFTITAAVDAPLTPQFAPAFMSNGGNGPLSVAVMARFGGHRATALFDPEEPFRILPASFLRLDPDAIILKRDTSPCKALRIGLQRTGMPATPSLDVPVGWDVVSADAGFSVTPPIDLGAGLHLLTPRVGDAPAFRSHKIAAPHLPPNTYIAPEVLRILSLDLALPEDVRIGYVGGGVDGVGRWLARMGCDVTDLTAADLAGDLTRFDTIVTGIFAFGLRPDLAAARTSLHDWIAAGGHLVTQYHRPSDGWDADATPPLKLQIGSPSLRWRVTDPDAAVQVLVPDHPLLSGPNEIGPEDWQGWDKERGLYFASDWHPAYVSLLSMHDANEPPLNGALLSAQIGEGRHSHVALVLHHQMNMMVPGAFRLMANLVQPATARV